MMHSIAVARYPRNYTHSNHLLSVTDRELIQRAINNNSTVITPRKSNQPHKTVATISNECCQSYITHFYQGIVVLSSLTKNSPAIWAIP